jgi:phosphate transport system permease protein
MKFALLTRRTQDRMASRAFFFIALLPLVLLVLITLALYLRARPILQIASLKDLLTGRQWQPLQGMFGYYPFILGTVWVTVVSMLLAVPACLLSSIYLVEYAHASTRAVMKPLVDLLSGIPSVVYGVWGMIAIVPWVQHSVAPFFNRWLGAIPLFAVHNPTGFSVLSGGIVLAVMVAPLIIAVTYEVMQAIPEGLREASLAIGATRWQTIKFTVLPKAMPGIIAAVVLGFSRAFGETMAVLMVVGNVAQAPTSIFDAAYPLTALIANNYGEMLSIPLYDSALLGAALLLLVIVLLFNVLSALALNHIIGRPVR